MDEKTRKKAITVLRAHGWEVEDDDSPLDLENVLDDAVHDAVSQSAAAINNSGVDEQLEYLMSLLPDPVEPPTDFEVVITVPFTTREEPDVGGRIDMTDDMTQRESVYGELKRLIEEGDLTFDLNPVR